MSERLVSLHLIEDGVRGGEALFEVSLLVDDDARDGCARATATRGAASSSAGAAADRRSRRPAPRRPRDRCSPHRRRSSSARATTASYRGRVPRAGRALAVTVLERRDVVGGACVTEELWPGVRASPGAYTLSLLRPRDRRASSDLAAHGLAVDGPRALPVRARCPTAAGRHVVGRRARTAAQLEARLVARATPRATRPSRERWERGRGAGAAADARAARPRALARGGRPGDPRRLDRRRAGRDPLRAGPRPVRDPGPDRHAGRRPRTRARPSSASTTTSARRRGVPGAWGFARGRDGRGDAGAALGAPRRRARACAPRRRWSGSSSEDGRAAGRRARGRGGAARRASCSPNADPLTHRRAGRPPEPGGLAPGRPDGEGHAPARRPARLPGLARPRAVAGTIDIGFTLEDLRVAAEDARAGRPAAAPWIEAACQTAGRPDARARRASHVLSLFCQCFPPGRRRRGRGDAAIARFAEVCPGLPDRIVDAPRASARASSRPRFGIAGGHIFHGEMLPGQLLEQRFGPRAFGGRRGRSTSRGRAPTPAAR